MIFLSNISLDFTISVLVRANGLSQKLETSALIPAFVFPPQVTLKHALPSFLPMEMILHLFPIPSAKPRSSGTHFPNSSHERQPCSLVWIYSVPGLLQEAGDSFAEFLTKERCLIKCCIASLGGDYSPDTQTSGVKIGRPRPWGVFGLVLPSSLPAFLFQPSKLVLHLTTQQALKERALCPRSFS